MSKTQTILKNLPDLFYFRVQFSFTNSIDLPKLNCIKNFILRLSNRITKSHAQKNLFRKSTVFTCHRPIFAHRKLQFLKLIDLNKQVLNKRNSKQLKMSGCVSTAKYNSNFFTSFQQKKNLIALEPLRKQICTSLSTNPKAIVPSDLYSLLQHTIRRLIRTKKKKDKRNTGKQASNCISILA